MLIIMQAPNGLTQNSGAMRDSLPPQTVWGQGTAIAVKRCYQGLKTPKP